MNIFDQAVLGTARKDILRRADSTRTRGRYQPRLDPETRRNLPSVGELLGHSLSFHQASTGPTDSTYGGTALPDPIAGTDAPSSSSADPLSCYREFASALAEVATSHQPMDAVRLLRGLDSSKPAWGGAGPFQPLQ